MRTGGSEALFRQFTPLVLLGVVLAVVFEPWLPGTAWLKLHLGDQVVLRGCVALLGFYMLVVWGEALRLHGALTGVLQAFRQFERDGTPKAEAAARNPKTRLEAARLLIAAMRSGDASIRETSRHNLARLVGQDLGADPDAWQQWLAKQDAGGPQG